MFIGVYPFLCLNFKEWNKIHFLLNTACRQQSVPRTFKEISAVSNDNTTIKDIGRCYKIIRKTLVSSTGTSTGISVSSSSDLIIRFCSKLNLPIEVRKLADFIMSKAGN